MSTTTPVLLTQEQIEERFDLSLYDPIGDLDRDRVLFFDGDVTINGSFDIDWAKSVLADLGENTSVDGLLIVVKGNLTVAGEINIEDTHPTLLVMGNVHCDVLISGDDSIHITGDAHIKYVLYGHYNDGMIT